jgi:hypothetical protein
MVTVAGLIEQPLLCTEEVIESPKIYNIFFVSILPSRLEPTEIPS